MVAISVMMTSIRATGKIVMEGIELIRKGTDKEGMQVV